MRILLATSNPHKLREVRAVFAPLGIEVAGLDTLDDAPPEPVEDADTFMGNALIKGRAYAHATGLACLAEDSGLEVDALGGEPGVISARYSGEGGPRDERDRANNEKLLSAIANVPESDRAARFVCAMCLVAPDGRVLAEARGTYEGVITDRPRGENGFGYDPLLLLPDLGRTSAELSPDEKNARSHRGKATRAMAERLAELHAAGEL